MFLESGLNERMFLFVCFSMKPILDSFDSFVVLIIIVFSKLIVSLLLRVSLPVLVMVLNKAFIVGWV